VNPRAAMKPQAAWTRALETVARATRDPSRTLPRVVAEWAIKYADRPALIGHAESYSFERLAHRLNQYARWGLARGTAKGATVALMLRNRPEYVAIWLGLTRIGAVVALIPPDLKGAGLAHALRAAEAEAVIGTTEAAEALREAGFAGEIWTLGEGERRLDEVVTLYSGAPLGDADVGAVTLDDRALRIFTSGTTGLPKAAEVSHRKIVTWTHWFAGLAGLDETDRHYNCLPMHHSVGGVVAVGAPWVNGGACVIAPKFSASRFWDDVARFECTSFQYIGELCRYLVGAPTHIRERGAKLRLALGNGLAAPVWRDFAARFPGIRVLEFYASTEGNVWLYNVEGRIGALGRLPAYLAAKAPIALAVYDEDAEAPARGADGFCRACGIDEPGEALGRIAGDAASRFEGYSDAQATERKILRDVFVKGDAWMRTGDLRRRDAEGFYAFVDRVGDTFRWKGENVACAQVTESLRSVPRVRDALVYGVKIPGHEGRAGMAAIAGDFEWPALQAALAALPRWARPVFLRLTDDIARTETFKPKRALYVAQGIDPSASEDRVFVADGEGYRPLTPSAHEALLSGALRV
jgi:fatty-acyl-CoA synthase